MSMSLSGLSPGTLENVAIEDIVACMHECFRDYFVPFGGDAAYWGSRFAVEGVDYGLSFGMFDSSGKLVAFVITAVQRRPDAVQAYNAGTGVTPAYRGNRIVHKLYEFGIPLLKSQGVIMCSLEVIEQNERAIRAYQRVGFAAVSTYHCYKGYLQPSAGLACIAESTNNVSKENPYHRFYSWDNTDFVISNAATGEYVWYEVGLPNSQVPIGFFVISPLTSYAPQFEIYNARVVDEDSGAKEEDIDHDKHRWKVLFDGISQVSLAISFKNVDSRRKVLINVIEDQGLEIFINQIEMALNL